MGIRGSLDVFVGEEILTVTEFEPQTLQTIVSRYTDWATAVTAQWYNNIEVEKMLREVVVEKFQALSWCLVAETEEVHENLKSGVLMCRIRVQPAILRLYIRNAWTDPLDSSYADI